MQEQEEQTSSKARKKKTKAAELEEDEPAKKVRKEGAGLGMSKASRPKKLDEQRASEEDDIETLPAIEGKGSNKAKKHVQEVASKSKKLKVGPMKEDIDMEEGPQEDEEEDDARKEQDRHDEDEEEEEQEGEHSEVDEEELLNLPASERTEPPAHFRYNNIYSSAYRAALARGIPLAAAQQRARVIAQFFVKHNWVPKQYVGKFRAPRQQAAAEE